MIGGDLVSTAKKTFGCGGFLKTTQPKKTFGCGGFLKSTQPKKTFGCGGFLSHKKMAVEKMKSHFGCGICPDRKISYFNSKTRSRNQIKSDDWLESKTERVLISLFPKQPIGGRQEQKFLKSSYHGTIITLDWTYEILTSTVF